MTFVALQPLLLDEDQILTQGGQNPPHDQLQQNAPTIGISPPQAPNGLSRLGFRFFQILQFQN